MTIDANTWPANTKVTLRVNPEATGRTHVFTSQRTGKRCVRIRMDDPKYQRAEGWADARIFMLGAGPQIARCVDCRESYRHDGSEQSFNDGFCPMCSYVGARPTAAPGSETRKIGASFRGTPTRTAQPKPRTEEPVTVLHGEDVQSDFPF